MYNSLQNSIYKIYDNQEEIYDLYSIYYNLSDAEKNRKDDILKKIDEIQNNSFDMIWNIVYKEIKRGTGKVKTDKKKNIYKYLQELQKIVNDNDIELSDTRSDVRSLIAENSCHIRHTSVKESLQKAFKKHATTITKRLRETAANLDYE